MAIQGCNADGLVRSTWIATQGLAMTGEKGAAAMTGNGAAARCTVSKAPHPGPLPRGEGEALAPPGEGRGEGATMMRAKLPACAELCYDYI